MPLESAEIRTASIRGHLRWWFRTLGGFNCLSPKLVRDQESQIFGATAGNSRKAGQLLIRVIGESGGSLVTRQVQNEQSMNAGVGTDRGYLLFPLRKVNRAGFTQGQLPKFNVEFVWQGDRSVVPGIQALASILGNLGSLGFRSRRAMGALAMAQSPMSLKEALAKFQRPNGILIRKIAAATADDAIVQLARWLKKWRAHGRTGNNATEQQYPGFTMAKNDHDVGVAVGQYRNSTGTKTFRPALGLPIVQFFSNGRPRVQWEFGTQPKGRFASPVILRPHRDAMGKWHALVLFIDAHRWPEGHSVYLDGQAHSVALDLYERMKMDSSLQAFC